MTLSTFDDLLQAAKSQPAPQRPLFVFAGVELPADAEAPLQRMVEAIKRGEIGGYMPFYPQGHAVRLG